MQYEVVAYDRRRLTAVVQAQTPQEAEAAAKCLDSDEWQEDYDYGDWAIADVRAVEDTPPSL